METIVDISMAMPGERFKFRMIGSPKSWYRYFTEDGYVDCESSIEGLPHSRMFATFAIDRADESLSVVVMNEQLAKTLSAKFRAIKVRPGREDGVDVDVAISSGVLRYLVDIGKVSHIDNPEIISKMDSMWDQLKGEIAQTSAPEEIKEMVSSIIPWAPRKWPTAVEISSYENIKTALEDGAHEGILISLLTDVVDIRDDAMSEKASEILRIMRIHMDSQGIS